MATNRDAIVKDIAVQHPASTRVFAHYGIDFCCGGGSSLEEACRVANLDVDEVIARIDDALQNPAARESWVDAAPDALVDHIVTTYHNPLRVELPRLQEMAEKVARVHGENAQYPLHEIASVVTRLRGEMVEHMDEEERSAFPAIVSNAAAADPSLFDTLESEHEATGAMLKSLREMTGNYEVPVNACTTWTALWHGLSDLERTMHEHVHLENNILFQEARV